MALQILRLLVTCNPGSCYQILDVITDVLENGDAILKEWSLEEAGDFGKTQEMLI